MDISWQRITMKAILSGVSAPNKNKWTVTCTRKKQNKTDTLRNVGFALIEAGQFRINIEVPLEQGDNELKLQYDNLPPVGFRIHYTPPNLHFFSIGINGRSVNVATKNADTIYRKILLNKHTLLYENIVPARCIREDSTTKEKLMTFGQHFITERKSDSENSEKSKFPIKASDVLIGYISSHGIIGTTSNNYFVMTKKDNGEEEKMLINYLIDPMSTSNCEEILLIVDACTSGHLVNQYKIANTRNNDPKGIWRADSTQFALLTSCAADEYANAEDPRNKLTTTKEGYTLFTHALLEALNNQEVEVSDKKTMKCSQEDALLTLDEIKNFVSARTTWLCQKLKLPQQTVTAYGCDKTPIYLSK